MKYYELEKDEQTLLEAVESGEFVSAPDLVKTKASMVDAAKNTLGKTRNINLRLSERDLYRLKAKAIEEGIPYQTLATSILHKAAVK
jgi:predicted DNA binding CopG/RHH family protein